jgi:methylmalonyl-CoA mutase C-terminal domain/subunit
MRGSRKVSQMEEKKIKILIAKPGLDGHDKGAKIIALALRDAGMEVLYTGLHQPVELIVNTAIQESVDIIGLSIMSGAHIPICRKLLELMKEEEMDAVYVIVGGVIPTRDIQRLKDMGISGVYPGGTPFQEIIEGIHEIVGN